MDNDAYQKKIDAFPVNFHRLKVNRERIPIRKLTTKYAKSYNALVSEIEAYAEWLFGEYLAEFAPPENSHYKAEHQRLRKKTGTIKAEERKPGGIYQRARDALIEKLDEREFEMLWWQLYERLMKEAWDPYVQRYNRWISKPGKRWIYNALFDAYWKGNPSAPGGGYWMGRDGRFVRSDYPPSTGKNLEKGEAK